MRDGIQIKDNVVVAAFLGLTLSLMASVVVTVNARRDASAMREQARLLEVKLRDLDESFDVVRRYTSNFNSLAIPQDRPWLKDAGEIPLSESEPDFLTVSLSAKRLNAAEADLGRFDRIAARMSKLGEDTDVLVGRLNVMAVVLSQHKDLIRTIPSRMPVEGGVSSEYGLRLSPFGGAKMMHSGIDIAARSGTPILAPADGVITFAGVFESMGNTLVVDHGAGILTRYGHASKLLVKKGQRVRRGTTIALVGSTGNSTGPHLHYEVWVNNKPANPRNFFFDVTEKPGDLAGVVSPADMHLAKGMGGGE